MNIIKAEQIKIGTQLAEADGFLWDVVEIIKEIKHQKQSPFVFAATFPASSSTGPSSQTAHRAASIRLSASLPACMV